MTGCTCGHTATWHTRYRQCEHPGCLCSHYQKNSARTGGNRAGTQTEGETSMPTNVPNPHPMQNYLDELDALIGQMTTLRYAIATQILADRFAMESSNPADRERAWKHYAALAAEIAR